MARSRAPRLPSLIPQPAGALPFPSSTLRDSAYLALGRMFTGEANEKSPADKLIESLRDKCRSGNPFPLIAHQWPNLLVTDPAEQVFFRDIPRERLDRVTPGMRDAILDPANPVLRLDWWQLVILAGFFDVTTGELFIKGCTGAGKGASVGIAASLWFDVYEESRITVTSRDYSHALLGIFGEIKQWFSKMKHPQPCSVLGQSISDGERHYIRILNPDPSSATAGEAFSGAHGQNSLNIFDEATSSPDSFFENAEKNARKIAALANPRTLSGRFRDAFKPLGPLIDDIATCYGNLGNRLCVTIAGTDCANVRHNRLKSPTAPAGGITIDGIHYSAGDRIPDPVHARAKPLIQNQIDLNQFRTICSKSDQRLVGVFAYGKFPTEDPEKQVILRSWLDLHIAAHKAAPPAVECFGFDIARSLAGDRTCLAAGGKEGCRALHHWQKNNIHEICMEALSLVREKYGIDLRAGRTPVVVDCDGLGVSAAEVLAPMGVWIIEFRGNSTSEVDPRTYGNLRAEAYATLGRRLNPDDRWRGNPWALPDDPMLCEELCAPEKLYGADALRFNITPKNKPPGRENIVCIKDKLGRSPDSADAVAYLFHGVRVLHNLNEWFMHATRELVVWPLPPSAAPPAESIAKPQPNDPPILTMLREQYGHLVESEKPLTMPDWAQKYKREAREKAAAAKAAEVQAAPQPQPREHWSERIWKD
jgi:hypothetical protein